MGEVNWGLGIAPNVMGNAFGSFLQGQQAQEADKSKNALTAYVTNPNEQTLTANAQYNPQFVMQERARMQQAQAEQAKQAREQLLQVSQLFDGVTDEASYQQRLNAARRMNLDVTDAPPNYDPKWVEETGGIFKFFAEKPEAMSALGKQAADEGFRPGTPDFNHRVVELGKAERVKTLSVQPGGGVATYDPQTGKTEFAIAPNYGGGQTGAPADNGQTPSSIPQGAIDYLRKNPKLKAEFDAKYGAGAADKVLGGGVGNGPGGFRPLSDARTAVRQVFPNARITDWRRPANSSLGRANPDSFHVLTGAAVDMAPIPGMTFQQAIERFARAGYTVHRDSRDEVNNPSGHATGPHWHFVLGGR